MFLEKINAPEDLRNYSYQELTELCAELRAKIMDSVSRNGGHLASNLGCVELTVALHRVFDSSRTPLIFDVGHQSYAHKLLTGRQKAFEKLRQIEGCSGFPDPAESAFDTAVGGHAGTAISTALGLAAARVLENNPDKIVAVVGDGALGNGISFEALNAANAGGKNLLVVLNDNRMSISPAVGAVSRRLSRLISNSTYNRTREALRHFIHDLPRLHKVARHIDDIIRLALLPPGALFQEFGFRFFGPVNGHNIKELVSILERIKHLEGPILLHVVTKKGMGADFAEKSPTVYHGVGSFELESGKLKAGTPGFSEAFGKWMCQRAEHDRKLVAVSPAMLPGTGLSEFAKKFPKRCFDAGIAEEHAAVFASGLALGGWHPVCAFYATFAQRALDSIFHDAALGNVPVIFTLDRAGAVPDGPTHHGIYDLGFLRTLPNITIMEPRSPEELLLMLDQATELHAPVVLRYPRGTAPESALASPAPLVHGKAQILSANATGPVLWAAGAECATAESVQKLLKEQNIDTTVVNARYLLPFDTELARSFAGRVQCAIEDHRTTGGLGSALAEAVADLPDTRVLRFGWNEAKIGHGNVNELRKKAGLTPEQIAQRIKIFLQPVH